MNTEAMLAVADVIEYADRMDMGTFGSWNTHDDSAPQRSDGPSPADLWADCGTVGCIGGWTAAWADDTHGGDYAWLVRDEFDITFEQAGRLVYGQDDYWNAHGINGPRTSRDAKKVARLLRGIARGRIEL